MIILKQFNLPPEDPLRTTSRTSTTDWKPLSYMMRRLLHWVTAVKLFRFMKIYPP